MAVNGGGWLTVVFEKPGYIPVHRAVDVRWHDYSFADEVFMKPYDDSVTLITFAATRPGHASGPRKRGHRSSTIHRPIARPRCFFRRASSHVAGAGAVPHQSCHERAADRAHHQQRDAARGSRRHGRAVARRHRLHLRGGAHRRRGRRRRRRHRPVRPRTSSSTWTTT